MNMKRNKEQFAASYLEDFAYKSKMKHSTSMVYDAILYHCKIISQTDEYRARQTKFVSQEKIAKMIGKSQRTVSKAINALKQIVGDPAMLLKRAGFIRSGSNSAPMDVMPDLFRGDAAYDILKDESTSGIPIPENNQEFHEMDWADIHRLAEEAKGTGNLGNNMGME